MSTLSLEARRRRPRGAHKDPLPVMAMGRDFRLRPLGVDLVVSAGDVGQTVLVESMGSRPGGGGGGVTDSLSLGTNCETTAPLFVPPN